MKFESGEKIIKQGTFTHNVIFVKSGIYKLHLKGPIQKDEILKIEKGPQFIGLPDVFANNTHSYSVTALSNCSCCFIQFMGYQQLVESNGYFALAMIKTLSHGIVNHYQKCVNKMQKQMHARFAEGLLHLADHIYKSDEFIFPLTRVEYGEYIGATRETITKIFHEFAKDQIIQMEGKKIKLLNRSFLERISKAG